MGIVKLWLFTVLVVWFVFQYTLRKREIRPESHPRPVVSLGELEPFIQTGDLLLFSCCDWTGAPPGAIRKGFFPAEISHVGVLYRDRQGQVRILEHIEKSGTLLQERLANYTEKEKTWIRGIGHDGYLMVGMLEPRATPEELARRDSLVDECLAMTEKNALEGPMGVEWLIWHEQGLLGKKTIQNVFNPSYHPIPTCSAFTAWTLQHLEILDIPVDEARVYLPQHFSRRKLIVDIFKQRGGFGASGQASRFSIQEVKLSSL